MDESENFDESSTEINITKKIPICLKCFTVPIISIDENKNTHLLCNCEEKLSLEEYLNQSISGSNKCDEHPDVPSVTFCIECKIFLCEDCVDYHVITLENQHHLLDVNVINIAHCLEHEKDKEYYCDVCEEYLCTDCKEAHKQEHIFIHIPTINSKIKIEELKEKIKEGEIYLNEYYPKIKENYLKKIEKEYEDSLNRNKNILDLYSIMIDNYIPSQIIDYNLIKNIKKADFKFKQFNEGENYLQFLKDNIIIFKKKKEFDLDFLKCIKTIKDHSIYVYSLCVLKDGRLASCSHDETIKIYNPINNYNCDLTIKEHTDLVNSLCVLEDGKLVSCGGSDDPTIRIWEINEKSYKCFGILTGHIYQVNKVICLPSNRIASCSSDKTIKIWDSSSTCECIKTLNKHTDYVVSLLLISDKKYMVSGSHDNTFCVLDINSYNNQKTIKDVYCSFTNSLLEIDIIRVAVGGEKVLKIVNISTAQIEQSITINEWIDSLLLLKDGNILIGGALGNLYHYEIKENKIIKQRKCHGLSIYGLIYLNEKEITSCSYDKTVKIWKA